MTEERSGQTSLFAEEPCEPILYWLWLSRTLGFASAHAGAVLDAFGSAQEAWEARGSAEFRRAAGAAAAARAQRTDNTPAACRPVWEQCRKMGCRVLAFDDPEYPLALSRIPDMPMVLYCTGDAAWLNEPGAVGIVGSRSPTEYGEQAAEDLGSALADAGALVISGLADGLDSTAHRAALRVGRPTVGVLGVPIDRIYPAANAGLRRKIEQNGCIVSEYPPGSVPLGASGFLQRNRLIAALSSALLVVEAREKSGTMSTVAHAERYAKPVFAVPGSIYAQNCAGTNRLLAAGRARAACCAEDLFPALGLRCAGGAAQQRAVAVPAPPAPVDDTERRVLACLGPTPRSVEEIAVRSGLTTAALLGTLMKLELAGRVLCQPGKRYVLR